ncbi:MAG: peptide deformylase [Lachnospiraceae bacterium]|nr:peptide deformylase [Lachnospiraceae bacterium]
MVREIVHDPLFLAQKSIPATKEDVSVARDMLDTLKANREACVGMAANMIGVKKNIIVFDNNGTYMVMFNPEIIQTAGEYEIEESCLSLLGGPRMTKRFYSIRVRWEDMAFRKQERIFSGFTAQIIQHEVDHLNGVLI